MCGFISIFGPDGSNVAPEVLSGLLAIQHRGQDAAGMVSFGEHGFRGRRGRGLVREVFTTDNLKELAGSMSVGHVRYPTVGANSEHDVQPFRVDFPVGIAMAHNGNVTNFQELKHRWFPERHIRLTSDCDLEAVLYVFAAKLQHKAGSGVAPEDIRDAVAEVFETVKGAYSVVGIVAEQGMFAFRDPFGIKPIVLGRKETEEGVSFAVASESVVLDLAGYERVRDLAAGEALWIDSDRQLHSFQVGQKPHRACIFEYIYFARPDSDLDDVSVYQVRIEQGRRLAEAWRKTGIHVDAVIPVPESARTAAQTMAETLGVPYREGFVKNRYVGRTFIMKDDTTRRESIRHKLNAIRVEFEGKDVLIVDDSIVRGNTSRLIVQMARQMGARKVYLASYSPPLIYPCPYGIDMSTRREFVARDKEIDQVARELGCDHLLYQSLEDMVEATLSVAKDGDTRQFCAACFTGNYPTGDISEQMLSTIETERLAVR
jgi:amidophosphoribosyltransferase